jgi:hypothetical protein
MLERCAGADTEIGWSGGGTVERRVEAWEDLILIHMMCVCVFVCVCLCRERERERETYTYVLYTYIHAYIHTCTYIHVTYVYTYIRVYLHIFIYNRLCSAHSCVRLFPTLAVCGGGGRGGGGRFKAGPLTTAHVGGLRECTVGGGEDVGRDTETACVRDGVGVACVTGG